MSDRWLYRISGQEFGPVSLDLVKTLVAAGTIAPDDEVRDADRSNWILACSATELSGPIGRPVAELVAERRAVRDEWYCRSASGEMGPLALSDLIQLAADGELLPEEEVKSWAEDYWRQIQSIDRLLELLPFPPEPREEPCSLTPTLSAFRNQHNVRVDRWTRLNQYHGDAKDILQFPGVKLQSHSLEETSTFLAEPNITVRQPVQSVGADVSFSQDESVDAWEFQSLSSNVTTSKWTGWMSGQEFGPVDFPQLLMWAVTGRLLPMDFVRRGDEDQYVPAVNIPCLFTVRAAATSLSRRQISNACSVPAVAIEDLKST